MWLRYRVSSFMVRTAMILTIILCYFESWSRVHQSCYDTLCTRHFKHNNSCIWCGWFIAQVIMLWFSCDLIVFQYKYHMCYKTCLLSLFFLCLVDGTYREHVPTRGCRCTVSILGFENCQSFCPTTAHVRTVCRNARRTAMRGAPPQYAARASLIGTTLAKLSKQLRNITYRQLFNKHTILSCLFLKMVVYCNKQLCK